MSQNGVSQQTEHEQILERKARHFFKNQSLLHVTLRKRDSITGKRLWERGWIKSDPGADCFFLTYTEEGLRKKRNNHAVDLFFYLEIEDIQEFRLEPEFVTADRFTSNSPQTSQRNGGVETGKAGREDNSSATPADANRITEEGHGDASRGASLLNDDPQSHKEPLKSEAGAVRDSQGSHAPHGEETSPAEKQEADSDSRRQLGDESAPVHHGITIVDAQVVDEEFIKKHIMTDGSGADRDGVET